MFAIAWLNPIGSSRVCWAILGEYKTSTGFTVSIPDDGPPEVSFGAGVTVQGTADEATRVSFLDCLKYAVGVPPTPRAAGQSQTLGLMKLLFRKIAILYDQDSDAVDILNNFRFEGYSEEEEWQVLSKWCERHQECIKCLPSVAANSTEVTVRIASPTSVATEIMPGYWSPTVGADGKVKSSPYEKYNAENRRIWYVCK